MGTMISPTAQNILFEGVSWTTYECQLADFDDSHVAQVTYDRRMLEILAPSYAHEQLNNLITTLVSFIATKAAREQMSRTAWMRQVQTWARARWGRART
jgi:hypothetical protein